jgi:type IV pilus assembly protein PilV
MKTQNLKFRTTEITTFKQQGSVILESLIAILIFSVGILAIVGLQGVSIKNVAGAKYRTDASLLANQIIGEMWVADKTSATALQANFNSPAGVKYLTWTSSVQQALPGVVSGVGGTLPIIVIDGNNQATITIQWQSPGEAAPHQHVTVARING